MPSHRAEDVADSSSSANGHPARSSSEPEAIPQQRLDDLWEFGDPAGSADRFSEAVRAERSGGAAAEYTTQLARARGLQERFDEAEALLAALEPADGVVAIRIALERGRLRRSSGDSEAAVPLFREAAGLAGSSGNHFLAADAYHMLALAEPSRAEEWTRQGLRAVARSGDARTKRWAGSLRNNLGWQLHDAGDHLAALRQFEQALEAYTEFGTPDQVHAARWAVARALRSLERFDEAADIQQELADSDPTDPYVQDELAELKAALGRPDRAEEHRRRADELRQTAAG